jgi:ribosome-binding factor A
MKMTNSTAHEPVMTRRKPREAESPGPSQRQLRVGEQIRHVLADLLGRGVLHDPELAGRSITVSEVRVSPDLKHATAFVLPLGGGASDVIVKALRRATPFLRGAVGREGRLRHAPDLAFVADTSFDHASRIGQALRAPHVARDLAHDSED